MTWAEGGVAVAWIVVGADNLRRARATQAAGGDSGFPRPLAALLVLGGLLAAWALLEQRTDRWDVPAGASLLGVVAACGGTLLHLRARQTLGAAWATHVTPRANPAPVISGPYAVIRHPLYVAVRLLGVAVPLVHPTPAALCLAVGLLLGTGLKARAEERALAAQFPTYAAYAAATPRFYPRLSRARPE